MYGCTKKFPKEEIFGLTSQLRIASVSVTSNIAEGFSRRGKKRKDAVLFRLARSGVAACGQTNDDLAKSPTGSTTEQTSKYSADLLR